MEHLFSIKGAFEHPVALWCAGLALAALVLAPLITLVLDRSGRISARRRTDIWANYRTWWALAPAMIVPLLLCQASAMGLMLVISLVCYREYARATGLFRDQRLSALTFIAIVAVYFAVVDNWYALFVALQPMAVVLIAAAAVLPDKPQGYLQRVSLASIGFLLFGVGLGHFAFIVNDPNYRPILAMLLFCVQLSDVLTFFFSRVFPGRRVFRNTSPGTTVGGQLAAVVCVALLVTWLGTLVFPGGRLDDPGALWLLGLLTGIGAQLGELITDSIKRDIGIRDMAATLPGHGGLADRFTGLIMVAPAAYHIIKYYQGIADGAPQRILSGML
ncbi:MAG: phosphatidate cytidylyltransferase [Tepidisphaera sp.]